MMRWLLILILSMTMWTMSGCVLAGDDGTPDAVVVDHDNTPPASNTTIIDHDTTPAPDANVDVHVDGTT